jgi:RNA polymerase sigma-70 factor (ECF subfamily)
MGGVSVTSQKTWSRSARACVDHGVKREWHTAQQVESTADTRHALLDRLRAGDAAAFEIVYEQYRARLHSFLLRLTGDAARARDLGQESWLRLAANAHRLAPHSDPGAWLFAVARNLFLSERRFSILRRARAAELSIFGAPRAHPTPFEEAARDQTHARLEQALASLPLSQREVVLLVAVEGFEAAEVGRMLDLDAATVRKRLSRGRATLKRALGGERL